MEDWEDPLEEDMTTHSSILALEIPWIEAPGRLQSIAATAGRWRGDPWVATGWWEMCGEELAHQGACTRGLRSPPTLPYARELLKVTGRAGPQEGQADGV